MAQNDPEQPPESHLGATWGHRGATWGHLGTTRGTPSSHLGAQGHLGGMGQKKLEHLSAKTHKTDRGIAFYDVFLRVTSILTAFLREKKSADPAAPTPRPLGIRRSPDKENPRPTPLPGKSSLASSLKIFLTF